MGQSPEIKTQYSLPSPFILDLLLQCPKGCSCPRCFSLPLRHGPQSAVLCGSEPTRCSHDIAKFIQIFCRRCRTVWWAGGAVATMTAQRKTTLETGQLWCVGTGQQLTGVSWKCSGVAEFPVALRARWHPCRNTNRASRCSRVRA